MNQVRTAVHGALVGVLNDLMSEGFFESWELTVLQDSSFSISCRLSGVEDHPRPGEHGTLIHRTDSNEIAAMMGAVERLGLHLEEVERFKSFWDHHNVESVLAQMVPGPFTTMQFLQAIQKLGGPIPYPLTAAEWLVACPRVVPLAHGGWYLLPAGHERAK